MFWLLSRITYPHSHPTQLSNSPSPILTPSAFLIPHTHTLQQLDKMSENVEGSEAHRKELQEYVGKLERKLGGRSIGLFRRGTVSSFNSYAPNKVEKESLFDALAELQNENAKLHNALQEVEEALDDEAKILSLADGGALLESLRTRRLLETAELALKKETGAKKQAETMLRQAEMRAIRAEDERGDRVKAEDALLVRLAALCCVPLFFSTVPRAYTVTEFIFFLPFPGAPCLRHGARWLSGITKPS